MRPNNRLNVPELVNDDVKRVLNLQNERAQGKVFATDLEGMRRDYVEERQFWNEDAPEMVSVEDVRVPTPYAPVLTRIYKPSSSAPAGTLYYLHGGGFILGNLDTHDRVMRLMAKYTGQNVIGIDYTLSPESKFPQALEEITAVCEYYHAHEAQYGLNTQKIGFAGDSAGAHLSMATSLWIRDHQSNVGAVVGLVLYYGLFGLKDSASRRLLGGAWDGLLPQDLAYYNDMYFASPENEEDPYYCVFNNDLTHALVPSYIVGAEFDPLLDDSRALAQMYQHHGAHCEYVEAKGMIHAFVHFTRFSPLADGYLQKGAHFFTRQL